MKQHWLTKRFLSFFLLLAMLLSLVLGTVYLGLTAPLHPGQFLYPLQNFGEQVQLTLTEGQQAQAALSLTLADRRLANLASAAPKATLAAVSALNDALETAVFHIHALPQAEQEIEFIQFKALLHRTEIVLSALEPDDTGQIEALTNRVKGWQGADTLAEVAAQLPLRTPIPRLGTAALVPFLADGVDHTAFPLTEGHADLACESCHTDGTYANTPTACGDCHLLQPVTQSPNDLLFVNNTDLWLVYPKHFTGTCESCHNTSTWQMAEFDHTGIVECASCHEQHLPLQIVPEIVLISYSETAVSPTHYTTDCQQCHTDTTNWNLFSYDHDGATECQSCHSQNIPFSHYPGKCTDCHTNIEDWSQYTFEHENDENSCTACHQADTPDQHFPGRCTQCHSDTDD